MVYITKKLIDQDRKVIIAEDITESGAKRFVGFDSHLQIFPYIANQETKCFHEVMGGLENRKLYFDADKKAGEGDFPDIADFAQDMKEVLICAVDALFGVKLDEGDICFTDSCVEDKFSSHIIVPSLNTSIANMRILYKLVSGALQSPDYIRNDGKSILDPEVYKVNQTLRLLHCNKMGKANTKKLWTSGFTEMDTVVSNLDDSTEIKLKPEIQRAIDSRSVKRESERLNQVAKSPEMFRSIVMGLAQDRADSFGDWKRVCLALGHEQAGVGVALEFARRSSKFNERATIRLYENGGNYSGRPLTIGSLLAMLKKDNIAEFKKITQSQADQSELINMVKALHQTMGEPKKKEPKKKEPKKKEPKKKEHNVKVVCEIILDSDEPFMPDFDMPDEINEPFMPDFDMPDEINSEEFNSNFDEPFMPDFDMPDEINSEEFNSNIQLKTEEKLEQWLGNSSFYLGEPVSDGVNALGMNETVIQYSQRFMKEYPSTYDTYFIKAQKGQGKTVALEKYIEEHKPKRVVVVSFRRSFSNEIMKRLGKLGFVNYRDIEGAITANRVIIQVESLHRLRWTEKCDLMVLDEIESIRSQFFSPTCKVRNAVIEKYDMLLRTSKQVFTMDADISENTVRHLAETRGGPENKVCYIENTHQEVQAGFKEYYTTKITKIMSKISEALDQGQKIVIPTNRSIEFMAGLKKTIEAKYPQIKIQMYNSKTIREEKVADELADVSKSWVKYDVIMYSPTVSAGVSFDETHFDKCFCIFTNNGKINSMRQMISRVRHFSSNQYYYCLQSFGGSSKPTTVAAFERHICSNRFLDKPEFIMGRSSYDGTREYPYKNVGYWLWVYNETEKARDKNMFIINFLREQYHAGIGSMEWMTDEVALSKITEYEVNVAAYEIKTTEIEAIANSIAISDANKADIVKRMEEEKPVSEGERYSLIRRNLLDCYELGERVIDTDFVETFNVAGVKAAYHNRKALEKGLKSLMAEESNFFNAVCAENVSVQDDLGKNYKSLKMVIAKELIQIAGFKGFYDTEEVGKDAMLAGFKAKEAVLIEKMPAICDVLGKSKRRRPEIAKWTEATYLKHMLKFVNSILTELFQLKIKQKRHNRSGLYEISGINMFDFSTEVPINL